jgi:DNA anti-recombination protein RmuC
MTAEADALRNTIIAAVQAELDRHAKVVMAETQKLREEATRDRQAATATLGGQIEAMKSAMAQLQQQQSQSEQAIRTQVEQALASSEARTISRVDDMTQHLDTMVTGSIAPTVQHLTADNEALGRRVDGVDTALRKFDEQAARMVTYFNEMTGQLEARTNELGQRLTDDVDRRIGELAAKVDDGAADAVRRHNETSALVTQRAADIEDRINTRVTAVESRMQEDSGTRIAEIEVHVGRLGQSLEDTLGVFSDRLSSFEQRVAEVDEKIALAREEMSRIDANALDDLKERLSSAAGESVLIRIDLEKLQKTALERLDGVSVKLTDLETQLNDTTMDVSTAVQLERLEEMERAIMELDPRRFVLKSEAGS